MIQLLGLVLISFLITSLSLVPFIDFLYFLRRKYQKSVAVDLNTPLHNKLLQGKDLATPVGGGLLLIPLIILMSLFFVLWTDYSLNSQLYLLFFTLISFGLIGLLDDSHKIFKHFSGKYAGLRARYIFLLQLIFATVIAFILYFHLGFNNLFIPFFGNIVLGYLYIPLALIPIVSFANAFNISDGLDGLSSGLLLICLFAFLVLASAVFNQTLSIFVGIWIGALIAYLYFNVFPARVYLGDGGAYGFGATLAVVGLLTGKIIGLGVIGGVFIIIVASSFLQIVSKRYFKRKLFPIAPVHMYFKYAGWEEPKIVMRFWLAGVIFAILGLWLALLSN
ncbi:hypothetical protein HYS91_03660 [Candidatus Daviesbacteria bacterium]|nr:hypothetical protein [Candidatus Daviesbacteria bacterium]